LKYISAFDLKEEAPNIIIIVIIIIIIIMIRLGFLLFLLLLLEPSSFGLRTAIVLTDSDIQAALRDQDVSVIQVPETGITFDPVEWNDENVPVPIDILRDLLIRGSPSLPILNMTYVTSKTRAPKRTISFEELHIRRFRRQARDLGHDFITNSSGATIIIRNCLLENAAMPEANAMKVVLDNIPPAVGYPPSTNNVAPEYCGPDPDRCFTTALHIKSSFYAGSIYTGSVDDYYVVVYVNTYSTSRTTVNSNSADCQVQGLYSCVYNVWALVDKAEDEAIAAAANDDFDDGVFVIQTTITTAATTTTTTGTATTTTATILQLL
jgi:hypothetical protein